MYEAYVLLDCCLVGAALRRTCGHVRSPEQQTDSKMCGPDLKFLHAQGLREEEDKDIEVLGHYSVCKEPTTSTPHH